MAARSREKALLIGVSERGSPRESQVFSWQSTMRAARTNSLAASQLPEARLASRMACFLPTVMLTGQLFLMALLLKSVPR